MHILTGFKPVVVETRNLGYFTKFDKCIEIAIHGTTTYSLIDYFDIGIDLAGARMVVIRSKYI